MTIETEYKRLCALRDAATPGPWLYRGKSDSLHKPPPANTDYSYGEFIMQIGTEDDCSQQAQDNIDFIASAHDMMALIERLMEERKTAERLGPGQGHPHQGCYQSQLGEQTAPISTRDAGPAAFGGRKTRRDHHD